MNMTVQDK